MTHDQILDQIHEQLSDIGNVGPDDIVVVVKPDEATDEQWEAALNELGMDTPAE